MWMTEPNPSLMSAEELADELRRTEAMAKDLGGNWEAEARLFRLRSETAFRRGKEDPEMIHNPADEISQREKRRILAEDRQVRSTYFQHAQSDPDLELGGRFKQLIPTSVTGSGPSPIPQQPEGSPWANDPIGLEPPLGFSVEDHEAVGELHEREGSAAPADHTFRVDTDRMDTAGTAATAVTRQAAVAAKSKRRM
jgi:hypothetical protein